MREFFGWLMWTWSRQETWQKLWLVAMFFVGMSLGAEGTAKWIILAVPATIWGFYLFKWAVWDAFQSSWAKYKEHRNSLLTTIKTSDKE